MGLLKKRKKDLQNAPEGMSRDAREEEIKRLESERMRINSDIEKILRSCAKETGDKKLTRRHRRLGKQPNDYNFKK